MRPFIKIPSGARLPPFYILKKRRRLFWSLYLLPVLSVVLASAIHRPHWFYVFPLFWTFFVLLFAMDSFEVRRIEDNWGRFERDGQPVRFWIHSAVWIISLLLCSVFPIGFAIQEAAK